MDIICVICLTQPGFESERIISQNNIIGGHRLSTDPDLVVRFAIPNERELRNARQASKISRSNGTRKITFVGDRVDVRMPSTDLPFKALGLQ